MRLLKQSTARSILVFITSALDHVSGLAGATLVITASKDGGAFASITPTVTDQGSGWYALALTAAHTDTLGDLGVHITASGADPSDILSQVVVDLPGGSVASVTGLDPALLDVAVSTRASSTSLPTLWDTVLSGHQTVGSTGAALAQAAAGGGGSSASDTCQVVGFVDDIDPVVGYVNENC